MGKHEAKRVAEQPKKGGKKHIVLWILAAILVVGVIYGVWFFTDRPDHGVVGMPVEGEPSHSVIGTPGSEQTRNFGIFWEPGAYSIYLNVALYFELFENKFNPKRIILLVATILSTLSTLGIVCMAILFCAFLTTDNKVSSKRVKTLVLIAGAFGLVFLVIYGGDFIYHVFNKLSFSGNTVNDSTAVRINAIIYPFNTFLSEPYFGVGYDQYLFIQERFCDNMATCTFINWLCLFGVVGGIIPIVGCLRFFTINNHKFITNCALFVFTMFLFSTENFIIITFIYMLIFYGFNKRNEVSLLRKMV